MVDLGKALTLYFHTIRYLQFKQILFRLIKSFPRSFNRQSVCYSKRQVVNPWLHPAMREQTLFQKDTFVFLNRSGKLARVGWNGKEREKLWRYNQHYFDDLNARDSGRRTNLHLDLISSWISNNPCGEGDGWEPYPTSLRIVNWVKWVLSGNSLDDRALCSLADQASWLSKNVEWHLLGNHLIANAKALCFAGAFFDGKEPDKWLQKGLFILKRELDIQILPDGGHFELSPMYHSIILEDLLDLINLSGTYGELIGCSLVSKWKVTAKKMLGWLKAMCHPDGQISLFNDAALSVSPEPIEIFGYGERLFVSFNDEFNFKDTNYFTYLEDSGYLRINSGHLMAILDLAQVGPDYLPAHGHADTLSFELSLFGSRVIVNGGTSTYRLGDLRMQERGTANHSTVEINNENSSEVWSNFRVARRAKPNNLILKREKNFVAVGCSHDGYRRLSGRPVHNRQWTFGNNEMIVKDRITGRFKHAQARFLLHPNVIVKDVTPTGWILSLHDDVYQVFVDIVKGRSELEEHFYSQKFGEKIKAKCIKVNFDNTDEVLVRVSWRTDD
jgi:uncharacterized heparinase superfamily protein